MDQQQYDSLKLKRLVEEKEKEWQQLAELRAERAEAELDKIRIEMQGEKEKFEKVKGDFSYNLQLLAGRDSELDAAEKTIEVLRENIFDKEREVSELNARVDSLLGELEKERKNHSELSERLRNDYEKQSKKQLADLAAQQTALKVAKEQLEEHLREVEANFAITKRQLEDGFQEELERSRKNNDSRLDEVRGHLAAADTEARLLSRELELSRDSERKKRAELANAEKALEASTEQIRHLEWALADKSAVSQAECKELLQKLEYVQAEREVEKQQYEQRLAQANRDLAEKIMLLDRMQRCRYEDAGESGKRIGEMQSELARLRAEAEKQSRLEDELRAEKESSLSYRMQLEQCETQIMSLTEANSKLEESLRQKKESATEENVKRDLQFAKEKCFRAEEQNKRLEQQNEALREAVRQMKNEVETILQSGKQESESRKAAKPVAVDSRQTQTDSFGSLYFDHLPLVEEEMPQNAELLGDPRLRKYVDSLVQRTSSLQHRCAELVAEGRRQQIKAESATAQLDSAERDCHHLRAALENSRYELSAERSRFEADKSAMKKQLVDFEERLAEARVVADEFHAEANDANIELAELRRRLASRELTQKSGSTGVGFGGQELYIQQLEDQIKDFATRAKPQNSSEATARLKRAIAIIVQLQKDRMRLLDLAARLRATADDYRSQLERFKNIVKSDDQNNVAENAVPLSTRSNIRPQSHLDKLETLAYEHMREKLATQMAAEQRRQNSPPPPSNRRTFLPTNEDLVDLSASFPNSEAIQELFQQIDSVTVVPPSEAPVSTRSRTQHSPGRNFQANSRPAAAVKSPAGKGRGHPVSRIWVSESSPPPFRTGGRSVKGSAQKK